MATDRVKIEGRRKLKEYLHEESEKYISKWLADEYSGAGHVARDILSDMHLPEDERPLESYVAAEVRKLLKSKNIYKKYLPLRTIKHKNTMMKRYGVLNNGQLPEAREKLSKRNNAVVFRVEFLGKAYKEYCKRVISYTQTTKRQKKMVPDVDYYTGLPFPEDMKSPDLMQGDLYPTIDHKLSVLFCFLNGISARDCAAESNLAWTFRFINSFKQHLTETQFRDTILPLVKPFIEKELINIGAVCEG